jgi:hypothetical protein
MTFDCETERTRVGLTLFCVRFVLADFLERGYGAINKLIMGKWAWLDGLMSSFSGFF